MKNEFEKLVTKNFSLSGQKGIVTGGSTGIGKAIAIHLAKAGAEIFVFSRTGKFKTDDVKINNLHHIKIDIINSKELKENVDKIGAGGLDFVVNNAGITTKSKVANLNIEDWNNIQEVNVNAAMNLSRFSFPYLQKATNTGRIVNITSMTSYLGFNDVVAYTVSKTALLGLTRGLAVEWANNNILVNSVSPGWIKTNMNKQVVDQEREKKILNKIPLGEYGSSDDIATMVWYLIAPVSKYITGQDFPVDGGALSYGY